MTQKRRDQNCTQFSNWLRDQEEVDSKKGFICSDIDFFWHNYKSKEFMLIEEKRQMAEPQFYQTSMFKILHKNCKRDPNYKGFHLIQFSNQSPLDGDIYLNKKLITKDQLISFLKFELLFKDI